MDTLFFRLLNAGIPPDARDCVYLIADNWDDWFSFRTMFGLLAIDANGKRYQLGSVKIGRMGLQPARESSPGFRSPEIPTEFDRLPDGFFSLGQGEDYYETLSQLPGDMKQRVLVGLRDCAFDLSIFEMARDEPSMSTSLLRDVTASSVTGRLHRLSVGDVELSNFSFEYVLPPPRDVLVAPPALSFEVVPESEPPTNVHVLIGRNGVGKSRAMRALTKALLGRADGPDAGGRVRFLTGRAGESEFAGLVLVSFSAFDDFQLVREATDAIPLEQVGLRRQVSVDGVPQGGLKGADELASDFRKSLERCRSGARAERWLKAVATLETDDLFAEADVRSLITTPEQNFAEVATHRFSLLSSGHAVVLLTVTRLVELVDERTLVLLDEPEGHLHPPLLSAFVRCLSDLLVKRNGVAIIATHSPVVLQEAPRSCAWKLRRTGYIAEAERPAIETFGENVGILTREVFGLEVTRSGFHRLLATAAEDGSKGFDDLVAQFNGQLGAEARAILRVMVLDRERGAR